MRVHTYVIATDAGSAPNYDPPAVTLAVCKPGIRKKAKVGDLVRGFAGAAVNPSAPVFRRPIPFIECLSNNP